MKLKNMKAKMMEIEIAIQESKAAYNDALQSLEKISNEIHKLRQDQNFEHSLFTGDEVCLFPITSSFINKREHILM